MLDKKITLCLSSEVQKELKNSRVLGNLDYHNKKKRRYIHKKIMIRYYSNVIFDIIFQIHKSDLS